MVSNSSWPVSSLYPSFVYNERITLLCTILMNDKQRCMYLCVLVVQFFLCFGSARLLYLLILHLYYIPIATDIGRRKIATRASWMQKRILNSRPHNRGNRYMQRIVLPQSLLSLATSVAAHADYYANQLLYNSSRGLKQSFVILRFVTLAKLFV